MQEASAPLEKQAALDSVLAGTLFAPLERLRDFLSYIVAEEMAGRGEAIRGKTIAQDVYGRGPSAEGDPDNVVRVDARRLRQTLEQYYQTEGKTDPLRIHVDTGGYCPRFETVDVVATDSPRPERSLPLVAALALGLGILLGVGLAWLWPGSREASPMLNGHEAEAKRTLERRAILDKSAASLQAVNLAEQAREMINPIFDLSRQALVTEIFRRVIALDPDYFGGYAGAAHTLGLLAVGTDPGPEREQFLSEASEMAHEAVRLEPTDPWAQSALAWAEFAGHNYDEALRITRRASEMAPEDGVVSDFYGTVTLFTGNFEEAADAVENSWRISPNRRLANRNIFAAANYHLGNFETSIEAFAAASEAGHPVSPPAFALHAASLAALGREREVIRKLAELRTAWPNTDLAATLGKIYQHPEHVEDVLAPLRALGWQGADGAQPNTQRE